MKELKVLLVAIVLLFFHRNLAGQSGYYNALLDFIGTEAPFTDQVKKLAYKFEDTEIIEYYSLEKNRFLGLYIDQESVSPSHLKFIQKNKKLRKLIKKEGLEKALSLYYDNISIGMTTQEVFIILGRPLDFKYNIDQSSQILECHFLDSVYDSLIFRDDTLEKINYQDKP